MKKKTRNLTALLLALLVTCTAFAGCGSAGTTAGSSDSAKPEATAASSETAAASEAAPSAEGLKPVTLHFYFFDGKKADTDKVWAAISEKYKDKLNATFDVQFIAGTDYTQKMLVKAASGDKWDLNFDSDWTSYYQMIAKDAYMNLDELLPKNAPDLYASYQAAGVLESAKSKGHIVSLPWTMSMTFRPFYQWRGDLVKAAGLTIDPASVKTVEDVDTIARQLKAAFPDKKIIENAGVEGWLAKYSMAQLAHSYVIDLNDAKCTVVPIEQTAAFKEMALQAKKWQDDGLIWKDVLTDKTDHNQLIDQGLLISKWGTHEFANSNRGWADKGAYWDSNVLYAANKQINRSPLSNLVAIPRTSENPDRALMFMNLLETDREMYDMVHYGILDTTYKLNGEEAVYPEGMTSANSTYMDWGGRWALWKPQFMRPDAMYSKDFWVKEAEFVKSMPSNIVSPLDGFNFDVTNVKTEVSQRDQIYGDANKMINVGLAGDAEKAVNDLIASQKTAGADKITAELQAQVDAFLATKK